MAKTVPPWTPEQVAALNAFQQHRQFHPFTCGSGNRSDAPHREYAKAHDEDWGQLVATTDGWVCPVCDYKQAWAHDFMLEATPPWFAGRSPQDDD